MQTWAKRGVQAALVTGGMLVASAGFASAAECCPHRPEPPLGDAALPQAPPEPVKHAGPVADATGMLGEVVEHQLRDDPDEDVANGQGAAHERSQEQPSASARLGTGHDRPDSPESRDSKSAGVPMTGSVAPSTDSLADREDGTQEIPALAGQHWHRAAPNNAHAKPHRAAPAPLERFAGHAANDVAQRGKHHLPEERAGGARHAADARRGSIGWTGSILQPQAPARPDERTDAVRPATKDTGKGDTGKGLVRPAVDPALIDELDVPEHALARWDRADWEPELARPAGLLSPHALDLSSADLAPAAHRIVAVPSDAVDAATNSAPPRSRAVPEQAETVLDLPSETLAQANEIPLFPELTGQQPTGQQPTDRPPQNARPTSAEPWGDAAPAARSYDGPDTGFTTPLPGLGDLSVGRGTEGTTPLSRVEALLRGGPDTTKPLPRVGDQPAAPEQRAAPAERPRLAGADAHGGVRKVVVDELSAGVSPMQRVSEVPGRPAPRSNGGGDGLPLFGGARLPQIDAIQGHTVPMEGVHSEGGGAATPDPFALMRGAVAELAEHVR